jgi:PDZ domain-containing secreted protein
MSPSYVLHNLYAPPCRYDLSPTTHIVEVDGADTPNLAAFIESTRSKHDGEVVRIKIVDLEGRCRMSTLKLDLKYWPTFSLSRGEDGEWAREAIGDQPAA